MTKIYSPKDWTVQGIDLSPYLMDLGKDYLMVPGRVLLFRKNHPKGTIYTELEQLDHAAGFALFKTTITDCDGNVLAVDYGSETLKGFPKGYIEKASTVSVGRALALAGFGTQFAASDFYEDGESKLADAPIAFPNKAERAEKAAPAKPSSKDYTALKAAIAGLDGDEDQNKTAANELSKVLYKKSIVELVQVQLDSLASEIIARAAGGWKVAS